MIVKQARISKTTLCVTILLSCALAFIRFTGLSDLMDHEQQRQAAYIMDAIQNHHWIMQIDEAGEIAAKPPLFTWLGAISTSIFGAPEPFAMRLVALVATICTVLLAQWITRKYFGPRAAIAVGIVYLVSIPVARQVWLARMDSLLPLTITAGAIAGWFAWQRGRGWTWFWLAMAAGMLAKGPVGLLCAAPLMAAFWEPGKFKTLIKGKGHWLGLGLFLLITLGWFAGAYLAFGKPVIHKLIFEEFLDQAVRVNKGRFIGSRFFEPPFYLIERNLPWGIFMVFAIWRIFTKPATHLIERRFERFIACWIGFGILPFCLLTHQRADLVLPLYVPASILAGRELARLLERTTSAQYASILTALVLIGSAGVFYKYHYIATPAIKQTKAVAELANLIKSKVGPDFPLTHVDDPMALNIDLNTMRPLYYGEAKSTTGVFDQDRLATYDFDAAATLLAGKSAAFIVTFSPEQISRRMPASAGQIFDLAQAQLPEITLHILSNRPTLQTYDDVAMGIGPLKLESHGLQWKHAAASDFAVEGPGQLSIANQSSEAQTVRITHAGKITTAIIDPGARWNIFWN